jgi:uncharacterized protein (TIGR02453 family)
MVTRATFPGFDRKAPGFFHELAAEQSRDWFNARKPDYLSLWQEPMATLLADVRAGLAATYRGMTLAEPKIFRIQRDVRFAADKSPYKTHIAGVIAVGRKAKNGAGAAASPTQTAAAIYLHLGLEEYSGAGHYVFEPEQLVRWRKAVAADKTGREIAALVAAAQKRKLDLSAHEVLQRVPKPYDAEHPRAELLRHKGLIVGFPAIPRGLIHKPAFAGWLIEQARTAAPVVSWLVKHIA